MFCVYHDVRGVLGIFRTHLLFSLVLEHYYLNLVVVVVRLNHFVPVCHYSIFSSNVRSIGRVADYIYFGLVRRHYHSVPIYVVGCMWFNGFNSRFHRCSEVRAGFNVFRILWFRSSINLRIAVFDSILVIYFLDVSYGFYYVGSDF